MDDSTTNFTSRHIMDNNSIDRKKSQRFDELKYIFELLRKEWPECFGDNGLYNLQAQIAVS